MSSKKNLSGLRKIFLPLMLGVYCNDAIGSSTTFADLANLGTAAFVAQGTTTTLISTVDADSSWFALENTPSVVNCTSYSSTISLGSGNVEFLFGAVGSDMTNWNDGDSQKIMIENIGALAGVQIGKSDNNTINLVLPSSVALKCIVKSGNSSASNGDFGWISPVASNCWGFVRSGSGNQATISFFGYEGGTPTIAANGVLNDPGSSLLTFNALQNTFMSDGQFSIEGAYTNSGTVLIESSITTNSGSFSNLAGGNFAVIGEAYFNNATGSLSNASGAYVINNGVFNNSSNISNAGSATNYDQMTNSGSITNSGTMLNSGNLTNLGTVVQNGYFTNSGSLNVMGGSVIDFQTTSNTFFNSGTVNFESGSSALINGNITQSGGLVTNSSIISVQDGFYDLDGGLFYNYGLVNKVAGFKIGAGGVFKNGN